MSSRRQLKSTSTRKVNRLKRSRLEENVEEFSASSDQLRTDSPDNDSIKLLNNMVSQLQLPKCEIKKFSGETAEYLLFKANLKEMILDSHVLTPQQKLTRLYSLLENEPQRLISACLISKNKENLERALSLLDETYGNTVQLAEETVQSLINGPKLFKSSQFISLYAEMQSAEIIMTEIGRGAELDNQNILLAIVHRIQEPQIVESWKRKARDLISGEGSGRYPTFKDLIVFTKKLSRWTNDIHYGKPSFRTRSVHVSPGAATYATATTYDEQQPTQHQYSTAEPRREVRCFYCNASNHALYNCKNFALISVNDRVKFVFNSKLCMNCISGQHISKNCLSKFRCNICKSKHHRLLHGGNFKVMTNSNKHAPFHASISQGDAEFVLSSQSESGSSFVPQLPSVSQSSSVNLTASSFVPPLTSITNTTASITAPLGNLRHIWFPVVQVFVNGHPAIALIDTCSTNSYVKTAFADKVGIPGKTSRCNVSTMGGVSPSDGKVYDLTFLCGNKIYSVNAHGFQDIPVPSPAFDAKRFEHLSDINFKQVSTDSVDLLLGNDMGDAIRPLEFRVSQESNQPYAIRTELGWQVCGSADFVDNAHHFKQTKVSKNVGNHKVKGSKFAATYNISQCPTLDDFKTLWNQDQDIGPEDNTTESAEDAYVLALWENNIKVVDGHIQLPIPIRKGANLPPSRNMAESRLSSLMKRLKREGTYQIYDAEIQSLILKGYAEEVKNPQECSNKMTWHVPHHHVKKKNDGIRIVNDCAAQINSKSVNTEVIQGPDLNNSLVGCLLRFRLFQWAAIGDIEAMYMQVKVPEDQRDLLRFLWFDNSGNIKTYRMTSHLFGGIWSPAAAIYALKYCASTCEDERVKNTIHGSFYVDDLLTSQRSLQDLDHVIERTIAHLSDFGFNLRGIKSNSSEIMTASDAMTIIGPEHGALGINWNVTTDELSIKVKDQSRKFLSKRAILSSVAKIFDPLGLISPVLLQGRLILREVVEAGVGWDDPLSSTIVQKWNLWMDNLEKIREIRIPRYVGYDKHPQALHTFVDASNSGYGCCVYLVAGNSAHLLFAKSKVAPAKAVTIPRLELCAAVLGVKVSLNVKREINFNGEENYWTDSMIVLGYLNNSASKYRTYVRNRVDFIQSASACEMWRHVPGELNPADIASRGTKLNDLWFSGPDFLTHPKSSWPFVKAPEIPMDDPEIMSTTHVIKAHDENVITQLMERSSSWTKLRRTLAWVCLFINRCKQSESTTDTLTPNHLNKADKLIFQFLQKKLNPSLHKNLDLFQVDGIYRVGGRVKALDLPCQQVFVPVSESNAIKLLIEHAHDKVGHMGVNSTLAHLRKSCWVARSKVKAVLNKCFKCKLMRKPAGVQKMSDIPPERLGHCEAPFYFTGLDCFGPFIITQGRKTCKRWGLIFTCMTMRAIHLEKVDSLDTSSFLNGLERFFSRRGVPHKITCDNGLNFVRGSKELCEVFNNLDKSKISRKLANVNIEWNFIPPYASHHGGVYERQIRTVRQVLQSFLKDVQFKVNDEIFNTFLCQVEAIVNGRPITPLETSPNDDQAITPNDILCPKAIHSPLPVDSTLSSTYTQAWKKCHSLLDRFWERWVKAYLPELQKRPKWVHEKENFKKGDVVLISDPNLARSDWNLGKIVNVKTGPDGLVRSVDLFSRGKLIKRPITKLINLDVM